MYALLPILGKNIDERNEASRLGSLTNTVRKLIEILCRTA
jgi:hypothetical protein